MKLILDVTVDKCPLVKVRPSGRMVGIKGLSSNPEYYTTGFGNVITDKIILTVTSKGYKLLLNSPIGFASFVKKNYREDIETVRHSNIPKFEKELRYPKEFREEDEKQFLRFIKYKIKSHKIHQSHKARVLRSYKTYWKKYRKQRRNQSQMS